MIWLIMAVAAIFICFAGVVLVGAPYLPTLNPQVKAALDLVDLKPGQTLLELGCGDGKVLLAAAERDLRVIGYELNPLLALIAWLRTRQHRQDIKIIWGDFWHQTWPPAEGIFVFLVARYMTKLDQKIEKYPYKPVKLVSFAFKIPGRRPSASQKGIFLYKYH